ncbi:MAG: methylamine utilization protein [Gammaproteobacteria bacterium]
MRPGLFAVAIALVWAHPAFATDVLIDVRDAKGNPLAEAVVYAEPIGAAAPAAAGVPKATIDQVNKEFVPRVSILQTGTSVSFPNSDNIRHSIYSFSAPKTFTTKLYSGREAAPIVFDKPGLVLLGCNIHDLMVAWVVVVDTPWFEKSGADGVGTLKGLPPGDYKLSTWFPSPAAFSPTVTALHVAGDAPLRQKVQLDVES